MLSFHTLHLHGRAPIYAQIIDFVKQAIFTGQAQTGDPLPPRREIAAQLGVTLNTVQKAFRVMETEGFVRTNSTSGSELVVTDAIRAQIARELTEGLVDGFIVRAHECGLTLPQVIALLGQRWTDSD